ncbi:hypothetical protein [Rhodococcus sp. WMMA185]|uniref:hypothetical protein n=1 Tax=Rhodococcus sp. WMMA185 TaxID=679318 RepID=UPI0012F48ED0|nr:hypothetical protein [Rhodococcus sp. WMMA185]
MAFRRRRPAILAARAVLRLEDSRRHAWTLLIAGTAISILAAVVNALLTPGPVPGLAKAAVTVVPALCVPFALDLASKLRHAAQSDDSTPRNGAAKSDATSKTVAVEDDATPTRRDDSDSTDDATQWYDASPSSLTRACPTTPPPSTSGRTRRRCEGSAPEPSRADALLDDEWPPLSPRE